jgi:hypothetical protein
MCRVLPRARLAATLIVVTTLSVARAASAETADLQRARQLFDEAGELELQGQWAAAQDRLRAALAIRETPHLRYALGWALENGGRLLDARSEYELALRLARRDGVAEVSKIAAARVAEVERKIPLVQFRVRGTLAKETRVLVDGRDVFVGVNGGTAQVDPGTRVVRIERNGEATTELSFAMAQGGLHVIDVHGDTVPAAATDGGHDSPASGSRTLPWVLVGGGAALVASGAFVFVSSADEGSTKPVAGALIGGAGLASLAAGAYLLLARRDRGETTPAGRRAFELHGAPLHGGAVAGATLTF